MHGQPHTHSRTRNTEMLVERKGTNTLPQSMTKLGLLYPLTDSELQTHLNGEVIYRYINHLRTLDACRLPQSDKKLSEF